MWLGVHGVVVGAADCRSAVLRGVFGAGSGFRGGWRAAGWAIVLWGLAT